MIKSRPFLESKQPRDTPFQPYRGAEGNFLGDSQKDEVHVRSSICKDFSSAEIIKSSNILTKNSGKALLLEFLCCMLCSIHEPHNSNVYSNKLPVSGIHEIQRKLTEAMVEVGAWDGA
jgi:hypothetical protein